MIWGPTRTGGQNVSINTISKYIKRHTNNSNSNRYEKTNSPGRYPIRKKFSNLLHNEFDKLPLKLSPAKESIKLDFYVQKISGPPANVPRTLDEIYTLRCSMTIRRLQHLCVWRFPDMTFTVGSLVPSMTKWRTFLMTWLWIIGYGSPSLHTQAQ